MTHSWPEVPLNQIICELEAGVSVNGLDQPVTEERDIGVLKVSCVSQGRFRSHENKKVIPEDVSRVAVSPKAGDIVISRANTFDLVGASGYVTEDYPNLFLSDKLWRVRLADPNTDSARWLIAVLNSARLRREFYRRATGTSGSMKNIGKESLLAIRVPRPPRDAQREFGSLMEQLDRFLQQIERLSDVKRTLKRGLMQQLLTGKRRFPEFKALPWNEVFLGDVFKERRENNRPDLRLLSVTSDRGLIPREELDKRDTSNPDKSKYKRVAVGDIAYNTMRMWQGVSALSSMDGIVSPAYTVVIPKDQIHGRFAKHLFKFPPVVNLFHRRSQGLVDDTLNLKFDRFAKIKLTIPSSTVEQTRIASVLDMCDSEIELLEALRMRFEQRKNALFSRLLSGDLVIT